MNPMNASEPREDAVADALKAARQFIVNGVEYGYIRLPEPPDTALQTLPKIEAAIAALAQQGAEPVAWQCRHRGSKAKPWSDWEECDHDSYVDITRRQPVMWEARALVPAAPATGAPR
jgi:hypothetical protein